MPSYRNNNFKIRAGHHTDMSSSAYLISSLPAQDDMGRVKWAAPEDAIPPQPVELVDMMNDSVLPNGDLIFQWRFSYMTFGMYKHWCDTFLPGKTYSANVTVVLFDDFDEEAVYQAVMQHRYATDREKATGGYANVVFRFVDAVDITP